MPGVQQRLALWQHATSSATGSTASENAADGQSALVTRLLLQYTSGEMSAIGCQKLAHAAVVDGCDHPEVHQVAALGNWGSCPGNVNRDLNKNDWV